MFTINGTACQAILGRFGKCAILYMSFTGTHSANSTLVTITSKNLIPVSKVNRNFYIQITDSKWETAIFTINTDGTITCNKTIYRGNIVIIYQIE